MNIQRFSKWFFVAISPIGIGVWLENAGAGLESHAFWWVVLVMVVWVAGFATFHFLSHLHAAPEWPQKNEWVLVYAGPIFWVMITFYGFTEKEWLWMMLAYTLAAAQAVGWIRYGKLSRRSLKAMDWLMLLAPSLGTLMAGSAFVMMIALSTFPAEPQTAWGWTKLFGTLILTIPAGISIALILPFPAAKIVRPSLPKNTPTETLLANFDWRDPATARYILERLESVQDYSLIPKLEALKGQQPRAWFQLSPSTYLTMAKLEQSLDSTIEKRLAYNQQFSENFDKCLCKKCHTRPVKQKFGKYSITLCRQCHKDDLLIYPVRKLVGVLANGEQAPHPSGVWDLQSWDEHTSRFIPGDYDEILLKGDFPLNYDWYVAAMIAWLEDYFAITRKPITLVYMRAPELGENTKKLIEVAVAEGKLKEKFQ